MLLSVDSFHQETIPLDIVKYFAMCIKESGVEIKLNPAWLVSKEDDNEYNKKTKKIISEFEDLNIPQAKGNVIFPNGNAVKYRSNHLDISLDRKSTRLNSSHKVQSRMPSSA